MSALIIGILFLLFTVYSILPFPWALQWWPYVADFIRGGIPVIALVVGLIAVLIGIADIRDRLEEKKEEQEESAEEQTESSGGEESSGE
jgi:NADH:ubiquinone oxidoreductase subunit 3 (subunit A)